MILNLTPNVLTASFDRQEIQMTELVRSTPISAHDADIEEGRAVPVIATLFTFIETPQIEIQTESNEINPHYGNIQRCFLLCWNGGCLKMDRAQLILLTVLGSFSSIVGGILPIIPNTVGAAILKNNANDVAKASALGGVITMSPLVFLCWYLATEGRVFGTGSTHLKNPFSVIGIPASFALFVGGCIASSIIGELILNSGQVSGALAKCATSAALGAGIIAASIGLYAHSCKSGSDECRMFGATFHS